MRRSTLAAFNLEKDSNPSPSNHESNAKAAEESFTAREHSIHRLAQGTGHTDPSNMVEFTLQPHGDMTTGILLELDTLGEILE